MKIARKTIMKMLFIKFSSNLRKNLNKKDHRFHRVETTLGIKSVLRLEVYSRFNNKNCEGY